MTEFSRPWPGVTVGDAGPYNVNNWFDVWGNMTQGSVAIGSAAYYDVGIFPQVGNQLEATDGGTTVDVDTGSSLVDGLFHYNNASVSVAIPAAAAGLNRIDYIVVRKNYQLAVTYTPTGAGPSVGPREARITVIRGTEAAGPVAPSLTQDVSRATYWDIPIATVQVDDAGTLSALTDLREYLLVWDTQNIADEAITEAKHNPSVEYGEYHPLLRQANDAIRADDSVGNTRGAFATDLQQVRLGTNPDYVASGDYSFIGGGEDNRASGDNSVVCGGDLNRADGNLSAVGGGSGNFATGTESSIMGGFGNRASGVYAAVLGGFENIADGDYSAAGGRRADTNSFDGVFIWADGEDAAFTADRANQFKVRASGGVHLVQNSTTAALPVLELEQSDTDEQFIEFDGNLAADTTTNISTMNGGAVAVDGPLSGAGGWAFNCMIKVSRNGTDVWIPAYTPV